MGITPPRKKFSVSAEILARTMTSYFGGRTECRIKNTPVPVVLVDFVSQYPTVNALLRNQKLLIAKSFKIVEASKTARRLLAEVARNPEKTFDPAFWKTLSFFAFVRPRNDLLPARVEYDPDATNIGLNYIKESKVGPIWYAGPDLVASAILTGRAPQIVSAFRLVPSKTKQNSLRPVTLRGITRVDPRKQDFFRETIEARARVKSDKTLEKYERDSRSLSLKILANAASYGLFVEVNVENAAKNRNKRVRFFSNGKEYLCPPSTIIEEPGKWYFPPISALITAGGRLLLAMLEREVTKAGGQYLLCVR